MRRAPLLLILLAAGCIDFDRVIQPMPGDADAGSDLAAADAGGCDGVPSGGDASYVRLQSIGTDAAAPLGQAMLHLAAPLPAGDALVIAILLSGGLPTGPVGATDPSGNVYTIDADVPDGAGNRTLVLSSLRMKPLSSDDIVTVTFPVTQTYAVRADELSGVSCRDRASGASGSAVTFASGTITMIQADELLYAAVGVKDGTPPVWPAPPWHRFPTAPAEIGNDSLSAAYLVTATPGDYTSSGTTSGTWMAGLVAFR